MSNPSVVKQAVQVNEALFRRLEKLRRALDRRDLMLEEIGQVLATRTRERFREGRGPDGAEWKPLSPKTLKRKKNSRILVESGELHGSIHHEVQGDTVAIGTNLKYAGVHQFGDTIQRERKRRSAKGFVLGGEPVAQSKIAIPARPFLGLSKSDEKQVVDIVKKHVARAVEGAFKA